MSLLPETAIRVLTDPAVGCLVVGFSGGLDSTALLHFVAGMPDRAPLKAIHVNHGLHVEADAWQAHCERICAQLAIPLICERVLVASSGSQEANARNARYQAFASMLRAEDCLLLAHHQQDQVETGLFQLLRGHGAMGLVGMPSQRRLGAAQLFRPLIEVPRSALEAYVRRHQIPYVSDPSNADESHDRNFIRHAVTPLLDQRFQGWQTRLVAQISSDEAARSLLAALGREDLLRLQTPEGYSVEGLQQLDQDRALNALKTQVMDVANAVAPRAQLHEGWRMLLSPQEKEPKWVGLLGYEYHRHRNEFVFVPAVPSTRKAPIIWPIEEVPADLGGMRLVSDPGLGGINPAVSGVGWTLDKQGLQSLKGQKTRILDRLRQAKVPPWVRQRLPLLVYQGEVIAIPAMPEWGLPQEIADGFSVAKNDLGWCFSVART